MLGASGCSRRLLLAARLQALYRQAEAQADRLTETRALSQVSSGAGGYLLCFRHRHSQGVFGRAQALPGCTLLHFAAADLQEANGDVSAAEAVYAQLAGGIMAETEEGAAQAAPPQVTCSPLCLVALMQQSGRAPICGCISAGVDSLA